MKIGISTACFYPLLLEASLSRVGELGFKAVEIFINCESEFKPDYIKALREQADSLGISIISVHPYTSAMEFFYFFSNYQRRLDDGLFMYERFFKAANTLGAKYLTFHGKRYSPDFGAPTGEDLPRKEHIESYLRLGTLARDNGIVLTQENVCWCCSRFPEYLRTLREETAGLIGFTLDIKQARRASIDVFEYIDAMGSSLKNIHLNDYRGETSCLLPGEGEMDYPAFLSKLEKIKYTGDLLIEVYSANFSDPVQITASHRKLEAIIK